MRSFKRNTLDLDPTRYKNGYIRSPDVDLVVDKLTRCPHLVNIRVRESPSGNGYHVELECGADCDLCRWVFDDARRISMDHRKREEHQKDVLWTLKGYTKGGHSIRLEAGPWR